MNLRNSVTIDAKSSGSAARIVVMISGNIEKGTGMTLEAVVRIYVEMHRGSEIVE
jgi:hypothetical protein